MTVQFYFFAFLDQFIEFFTSDADQRTLYTALAAVTVKFCRDRIVDFNIKTVKYLFQKALRCMALLQKCRYGLDLLYIFFKFCDRLFFCKRHNLYDKTSSLTYGIIFVHQNAEPYC